MTKKIPLTFYRRSNVVLIAEELLGKILVTRLNGITTSVRIVECEAYEGTDDRASHAWGGKRTARTEVMYKSGGLAYVYLCYGVHHLFNVVTNNQEIPHAILIRAGEPLEGIKKMARRTGKSEVDVSITRGPGNLSKALGISTGMTGLSLVSGQLFLKNDNYKPDPGTIGFSPRIGVDYAGKDAARPYRIYIKGNPYVSGKPAVL